jgi:protein-S-isoprenylcysteine O-methyltransferase Ste14
MISHLFEGLWLFWLIYWVALSFGNKRTVTQVNPAWRIATILCVVALFLAIRHCPDFRRRLLPPSEERAWIGFALAVAGIAFSIWARNTLGRNWSSSPVIKENQELIQNGPYSLVRHPIYTGLLLAVFGTALAAARISSVTLLVVAFILLLWKMRLEESLMQQQFPEAYPAYRARTKALIPFVF